jgi:prepilin-type N-terminal cleavage/methylation domain-containing protein
MVRHRKSGGFTLVELLVVIAIIAILIALLIGPIMRARRAALVLACPIATRAANNSAVLVHPHGSAELTVASRRLDEEPRGAPEWSTNGTWIGYTNNEGFRNPQFACIIHAMTGKERFYTDPYYGKDCNFLGWADDDHFITLLPVNDINGFALREAATGRVTQTYATVFFKSGLNPQMVRRVPSSTGAYYITIYNTSSNVPAVALLRKDFSIKKVLYISQDGDWIGGSAGVDPFGEYAAWTGNPDPTRVAIKQLKASTAERPFRIPPPDPTFFNMCFLDWTEDGNILAMDYTSGPSQRLVIMTRTGKLLSIVRQDKPTFYPYASWRKYMHQ